MGIYSVACQSRAIRCPLIETLRHSPGCRFAISRIAVSVVGCLDSDHRLLSALCAVLYSGVEVGD